MNLLLPLFAAAALSAAPIEWPDLSAPAPAVPGSEGDSALVVAIEHYGSVPGVPGAVENGNDWYRYFTKTLGLKPSSVFLLRDNEGTLEKMKKFARLAGKAASPGARTWIVFIGHGAPSADGKDGVLVGYDAQADIDSLYARSLARKDLLKLAAPDKDARPVLILDACFSGLTASGKPIIEGLQPLVLTQNSALPSRSVIISAGKSDQFAGPLPGKARPAFSYLLLGALRGWGDKDKDGMITFEDALTYAKETLQAVLKDRTQTPEIWGEHHSQGVSTRVVDSGPDITSLVVNQAPAPAAEPVKSIPLNIKTPVINIPSTPGGGLEDVDLEVEKKLDIARGLENQSGARAHDKAQAWCALAALTHKNPYLESAKKACADFTTLAEHLSVLYSKVDSDAEKLKALLALENKEPKEKITALSVFLDRYSPLGPNHWHVEYARKAHADYTNYTVDLSSPNYKELVQWMLLPDNLIPWLESYADYAKSENPEDAKKIILCVKNAVALDMNNEWKIKDGVLPVTLYFPGFKKVYMTLDIKIQTGFTIKDLVKELFRWAEANLTDPRFYKNCPRN